MKSLKFLIVTLLLSITCTTFAQTITISGGANISNLKAEDNDGSYDNDFESIFGGHGGITAEFSLGKSFFLETGLLYNNRGFKIDSKDQFFSTKGDLKLHYLNIPINAVYKLSLNDKISLYGSAGPYLGYGLSGKYDFTTEYVDEFFPSEVNKEDVEWGSDNDDDFKRLDAGFNFGAGIEISQFRIGTSYMLGLANIAAYEDEDNKINNKGFSISVGYRINLK